MQIDGLCSEPMIYSSLSNLTNHRVTFSLKLTQKPRCIGLHVRQCNFSPVLFLAAPLRSVKQNKTKLQDYCFLPTIPNTKENTVQRLLRFVSVFGPLFQNGRDSIPEIWSNRSVVSNLLCAQVGIGSLRRIASGI